MRRYSFIQEFGNHTAFAANDEEEDEEEVEKEPEEDEEEKEEEEPVWAA